MCDNNMDNEMFGGQSLVRINIIYLLDCSGSMKGQRITQLNNAMPEAFEVASEIADEYEADLSIRVIKFSSDVEYLIGSVEQGATYEEAVQNWKDVVQSGSTRTDLAIEKCLESMHTKYLGTNNYQPVVFLITDGYSDDFRDGSPKTNAAIDRLAGSLRNSKGESRVMRVALGVEDAERSQLERFASTGVFSDGENTVEAPIVAEVHDVRSLKDIIKSITVSSLISSIKNDGQNIPVIEPDPFADPSSTDWINQIFNQNQGTNPDSVL